MKGHGSIVLYSLVATVFVGAVTAMIVIRVTSAAAETAQGRAPTQVPTVVITSTSTAPPATFEPSPSEPGGGGGNGFSSPPTTHGRCDWSGFQSWMMETYGVSTSAYDAAVATRDATADRGSGTTHDLAADQKHRGVVTVRLMRPGKDGALSVEIDQHEVESRRRAHNCEAPSSNNAQPLPPEPPAPPSPPSNPRRRPAGRF